MKPEHRRAQFRSTIALVLPTGEEFTVEGVWHGALALEERGDNGFGYDPVFVPDVDGQPGALSAAEISAEQKNAQSHRARAFVNLVPLLERI